MADNSIQLVIRTVDEASAQIKAVGDSVGDLGGVLEGLAGIATTVIAAFEGFHAITDNIIESQNAAAQLTAAFKATGDTLGLTRSQLDGLASTLSETSTASNSTVQSAESLLLTFDKIQGDTFPRALQAASDLAARMGESLPQAAEQLGRALQDPEQGLESLRRAGVIFTDAQKDLIKSFEDLGEIAKADQIIIDQIEKTMGGAAAAAAETLGGSLARLTHSFLDMLTPSQEATQGLVRFFDELNGAVSSDAIAKVDGQIALLKDRIEAVGNTGGGNLVRFGQSLTSLQAQLNSLEKQRENLLTAPTPTKGREDASGVSTQISASEAARQSLVQLDKSEEGLSQSMAEFKLNSDWLDEASKQLDAYNKAIQEAQQLTETAQEKAEAADSKFLDALSLLQKNGEISGDEASNRLDASILPPIDLQQQTDQITKTVDEGTKNAIPTKLLTDQYTHAIKGIQDAFAHMFDSINKGWDGMAKAFISAIQEMVSQLLSSSLMQLLFGKITTNADGSQSVGGLFGAIGSLFGGGAAATGTLGVATEFGTIDVPTFAAGGTAPGGLAWVGENGPELVSLPGGAQVYNQQQIAAMGGGAVINHSPTFNLNVAGSVDRQSQAQILAATAQMISSSQKELVRTFKRNGYSILS